MLKAPKKPYYICLDVEGHSGSGDSLNEAYNDLCGHTGEASVSYLTFYEAAEIHVRMEINPVQTIVAANQGK